MFRVFCCITMGLLTVIGAVAVSAWGPHIHARAVFDAYEAAPEPIRAAIEPFADKIPEAVMEPHSLWGAQHQVEDELPQEIDRAARLFPDGNRPYKRFKALMRVAHLSTDAVLQCRGDTAFIMSAEDAIQKITTGVGFQIRLTEYPAELPKLLPCEKANVEQIYANAVEATLWAWLQVAKKANTEVAALKEPIAIRKPFPKPTPKPTSSPKSKVIELKPSASSADFIGRWHDPRIKMDVALYKYNGKTYLYFIAVGDPFSATSSARHEYTEVKSSQGRQFNNVENYHSLREHCIILPSGQLEWRDIQGLITTLSPVN